MVKVVVEYPFHSYGCAAVVDECVYFKIVFKTAKINICRAACAEAIVGNENFGVVESGSIKKHFDTRINAFPYIRTACPFDETSARV